MKDYIKKTAEFYDKNIDEFIEKTKDNQKLDTLNKFIESLPKGSRVLDLGCAWGRESRYLSEKGFDVIGVDISPKMIVKAKHAVKGVGFKVMNATELEFEDASFDGVWAIAVLVHLSKKDVKRSLGKIKRILKPGGVLHASFKEGSGEGFISDKRFEGKRRFYSYFSEEEITELVESLGFNVLEVQRFEPGGYRIIPSIHLIARLKSRD
jgi:ubiquinone/menaquinone biosynthesis C-methylase UbiE